METQVDNVSSGKVDTDVSAVGKTKRKYERKKKVEIKSEGTEIQKITKPKKTGAERKQNGWNVYYKSNHATFKDQHKNLTNQELTKIMSKAYKERTTV